MPADRRDAVLADPYTLAAFGFGIGAGGPEAPHWLQIPLAQHGAGRIEVWRGASPAERGIEGRVRWSRNREMLFTAIEIDEAGHGIEAASAAAYAEITAFLAQDEQPHLLRTWNYLDAITEGEGDDERYRQFCLGRVRGLRTLDEATLPAATCVGGFDGRRRVQVYCLAARQPGIPLENPRQVSAYAYPRQYGPQSPSFARAMLPPAATGLPLLQSGTAAITGHASRHAGMLLRQCDEVLLNLASLIDAARTHRPSLSPRLGGGSLLKVYVREANDMQAVADHLRQQGFDASMCLVLHGEVCRAELLVEIEGMHY
ncbi:pteridine-dependent deoxygenase [Stenotrophomonas mori]|uniref:Pteridine-dependent deoxygenase n=1 Tax=Stenotrophomonas mori TaxID=2871096 RepID=A0ABT0SH76_9GAMM|nr:pteridine-dependent deoxygenase [Stenotrophomonas mori]